MEYDEIGEMFHDGALIDTKNFGSIEIKPEELVKLAWKVEEWIKEEKSS